MMLRLKARHTKFDDFNKYLRYLENREDLEFINNGSFGTVYDIKNRNRVLKVGLVNSDNYINYLRYIGLSTQNPNLPRLESIKLYDSDSLSPMSNFFYEVVMEKLLSSDQAIKKLTKMGLSRDRAIEKICSYWQDRGVEEYWNFNAWEIQNCFPTDVNLLEIKQILCKMYNRLGADSDLCESNIMWRIENGNVDAVFTDPIV